MNPNCKFTFGHVVKLLILFPFFSVKTASDYGDSGSEKLFFRDQNMFYCLMDDEHIGWSRTIYSINRQFNSLISLRQTRMDVPVVSSLTIRIFPSVR